MKRWRTFLGGMVLILGITAVVSGCSWWNKEEIRFSALRFFQQGNTAFEQMDYHEAILNYHKAIEMDDESAEFHYNLGLAYYYVEKYENSLEAFEMAAELAPKMAETYYNVALVYNKLYEAEKAHRFFNMYQSLMTQRKQQQLQSNLPPQTAPPATANSAAQPKPAPAKAVKNQEKPPASQPKK